MTKVKTILAEFCSPKEILAINQLGLLKKEERESQPVPWRHRLPNEERRRLVKSEMRMSLRPTTRLTARDKDKAVSTARSPKDSRLGECLFNIHVRGDPHLGSHLGRIGRQQKRTEHSLQHTRQNFLRRSQCLNHEPLILVERPPSPNVRTRALLINNHGIDPVTASVPSYRRPLRSRSRTPSTLTTIDAFMAESKKKKNVWEEAMEDKDGLKFKCTARPSAPLTQDEVTQLKIGHSMHKPTQESISTQRIDHGKEKASSRPKSRSSPSVFITQPPEPELPEATVERISKSVTFSEVVDTKQVSPPSTATEIKDSSSKERFGRKSPASLQRRERGEKKLKNFLSVLVEQSDDVHKD